MSGHPAIEEVADHAVLVMFGEVIDDAVLARVHGLDLALVADPPAGMVETVPAMTNLLVVFDPLVTDHRAVTDTVLARLDAPGAPRSGRHHVIDVCYDPGHAPDLGAAAARLDLPPDAVVEAHLSGRYTVGMYGFAPGFAYLYGTPHVIQLPRNPTPGDVVPAGSVIIAGQQCLITPIVMSTGWFAIGRSPSVMMTGDDDRPFLLDVGDTVGFRRIGADELERRVAGPGGIGS